MKTSESPNPENTSRPFGYWLKAADRLMAAEFATAFDGEHASRRDWRILNIVDGTVPSNRPLNGHKLHRLVERGWVTSEGDGWTLTDDGRVAKERLDAIVDEIRTKVADAVSPEDMATTLASLEKIARAFGWDEETPLPRGRRRGFGGHGHGHRHGFRGGFGRPFGRGFGPGSALGFAQDTEHTHGRDFGPGHGRDFGPGHGRDFAPGHDADHGHRHGEPGAGHHDHGHGHGRPGQGDHGHRGHGPHRAERIAQHAFERGFDAGFTRGRDA